MLEVQSDSYGETRPFNSESGRYEGQEVTQKIDCFLLLENELTHIKKQLGDDYEKNSQDDSTLEHLFKWGEKRERQGAGNVSFLENIVDILEKNQWKYGKEYQLLWSLATEGLEHKKNSLNANLLEMRNNLEAIIG